MIQSILYIYFLNLIRRKYGKKMLKIKKRVNLRYFLFYFTVSGGMISSQVSLNPVIYSIKSYINLRLEEYSKLPVKSSFLVSTSFLHYHQHRNKFMLVEAKFQVLAVSRWTMLLVNISWLLASFLPRVPKK